MRKAVLNFGATWCPPSKMEVLIVEVSMDHGEDKVEGFARTMGINYSVFLGTAEVAAESTRYQPKGRKNQSRAGYVRP